MANIPQIDEQQHVWHNHSSVATQCHTFIKVMNNSQFGTTTAVLATPYQIFFKMTNNSMFGTTTAVQAIPCQTFFKVMNNSMFGTTTSLLVTPVKNLSKVIKNSLFGITTAEPATPGQTFFKVMNYSMFGTTTAVLATPCQTVALHGIGKVAVVDCKALLLSKDNLCQLHKTRLLLNQPVPSKVLCKIDITIIPTSCMDSELSFTTQT